MYSDMLHTVYNKAIATLNTEIVIDSVAILFIADIDEYLFKYLVVVSKRWASGLLDRPEESSEDPDDNLELEHLKREIGELKQCMLLMETDCSGDASKTFYNRREW